MELISIFKEKEILEQAISIKKKKTKETKKLLTAFFPSSVFDNVKDPAR